MSNQPAFNHAVVLGSGIAGLMSCVVLAGHFKQVTLIEKDAKPEVAGFREGVPQGRHFHALIPGGLEVMESLLPGIKAELRAAGSVIPGPDQFYFYTHEGKSYAQGRYMPEPPKNIPEGTAPYMQTRGQLEFIIRTRISALPNVQTRYDTVVKELLTEHNKVIGVIIDKSGEEVKADLVIDALGKTGRTLKWIEKLGFEKPEENIVNCDFAYTSIFIEPSTPDLFTDAGYFVAPHPEAEHKRGGALVRMEDGSLIALVGGRYGDFPPRDFEGFLEYGKSIAEPSFLEIISQSTLIGKPAHFRFPKSIRRRFDQLSDFPDGLLAIGDSFCHFNPVYGQGMTSACRQVWGLKKILDTNAETNGTLEGIWREVFASSYQETRTPWLFASLQDFLHPNCTGDMPTEDMDSFGLFVYVMNQGLAGNDEAMNDAMAIANLCVPLSTIENSKWADAYLASKDA